MGAIRPELKVPRTIRRKDGDKVDLYAEGGVTTKADEPIQMYAKGGGLYDNINAKRARITAGSGEKMRKPGTSGAPTAQAFKQSAKTAKR